MVGVGMGGALECSAIRLLSGEWLGGAWSLVGCGFGLGGGRAGGGDGGLLYDLRVDVLP